MRPYLSFSIAAAMALVAQSAHAQEGFELCNRTKFRVVYAKALNEANTGAGEKDRIVSEGWFELAPGQCDVLYPGKLKSRYYLVYAEAKGSNRKWSGEIQVCVRNSEFRLVGETCPANKTHRRFVEVDTGDYDTFTYDLD